MFSLLLKDLISDFYLPIRGQRENCLRLYDKREDFNFAVVNFSFLSRDISSAPAVYYYVLDYWYTRVAQCESLKYYSPSYPKLLMWVYMMKRINMYNTITFCIAIRILCQHNEAYPENPNFEPRAPSTYKVDTFCDLHEAKQMLKI